MDTKLTLSLDESVIKKAKTFAKKNHTSLSQMVENYLSDLTRKEQQKDEHEISPLIKGLSGVLQLPANYDYKKDRTKYLDEKYK